MKRKIYQDLIKWKEKNGRTALLIEGARRVGKSYIVHEFAQKEYRSFIMIDFSKTKNEIKELFDEYLDDLDTFFNYLEILTNTRLFERDSLIVFDEVQLFPKARQAIKHLVKDGRYDYIETGSLISIKNNVKDILIPSEEERLAMYPLDFEEFLWTTENECLFEAIRNCFLSLKPLGPLHRKAMQLFRQYMIIGGMPQAVETFINTNDFKRTDEIKRGILSLYKDDIAKNEEKALLIKGIFDDIPSQLSKHEKRFTYSKVRNKAKLRDMSEPFTWLKESMIVNICYKALEPNFGLKMNLESMALKCYMGDTGLLLSHAFDEKGLLDNEIYRRLLFDKLSINKGMLTENIVAQMLVSSNHKLYYYANSSRQNKDDRMEIDFLVAKSKLTNKHNISPIEVKSSKYNTHRSLDKFNNKYSDFIDKAYVLDSSDVKIENDIIYLPLYMTPFI